MFNQSLPLDLRLLDGAAKTSLFTDMPGFPLPVGSARPATLTISPNTATSDAITVTYKNSPSDPGVTLGVFTTRTEYQITSPFYSITAQRTAGTSALSLVAITL